MTPRERVLQMILGYRATQLVHVAAALDLADALGGGPQSSEALASRVGAEPRALRRLLRALVSVELLAEEADGRFALTEAGRLLRRDAPASLHARALTAGSETTWRPWGELQHCVRTGEPGFDRVFGVDQTTYYAAQGDAGQRFDATMTAVTDQAATALIEGYDLSSARVVVDVGGGQGALLATILRRDPELRGVLFDQPQVVAQAAGVLEAAGVAGRCEVRAGDFFDAVPAGGDVYVLKWILHGWGDADAVKILRVCRAAMRGRGRLVLVESVIPRGSDPQQIAVRDVHMMVMATGHERTEEEYRGLLAEAGFSLLRVISTRSQFSLLEAEPAELTGAAPAAP